MWNRTAFQLLYGFIGKEQTQKQDRKRMADPEGCTCADLELLTLTHPIAQLSDKAASL